MKKLVCLFTVLYSTVMLGQWQNGGARLTFDNADQDVLHSLSPMEDGGFYMVWTNLSDRAYVALSSFNQAGELRSAWPGSGLEISNPDGIYQWKSQIITSEDGNAIVCWFGESTVNTGTDRRHIFVQKYSPDGLALWNSSMPIQVSNADLHHMWPHLISDGNGGCIISWVQYDLNFIPSSQDILMAHVDSGGMVNSNWNTTDPDLVATNQLSTAEYDPQLALSKNGEFFYLLFNQGLLGNVSHRLLKVDLATGQKDESWGDHLMITPGPNIFPGAGRFAHLFVDDEDHAIVFWTEFRVAGEHYLQRISPQGESMLDENGKILYVIFDGDMNYTDAVMNPDGTLTFAWRESMSIEDYVRIQRVDSEGKLKWITPYTINMPFDYAYPDLVVDGSNGNFVFFKDRDISTGKPEELICTRITEDGMLAEDWPNPGITLNFIGNPNGTSPDNDFQAIAPLNGLAIIVWNIPVGNGTYDLFGCNVLADASYCDADSIISDVKDIHQASSEVQIYPNPTNKNLYIELVGDEYDISIYSISGLFMQKLYNKTGSIDINLSSFSPGTYIILLESNRETLRYLFQIAG